MTKDILYDYDLFNRLVRVTLHTTDNGPLTTDTFHIYDGERWERGNAGDHLALVFDGNGDLTNRYLHGPAVDQILADEQLDSLTTPGDVHWPLSDNLGTVRDLAAYDDATGAKRRKGEKGEKDRHFFLAICVPVAKRRHALTTDASPWDTRRLVMQKSQRDGRCPLAGTEWEDGGMGREFLVGRWFGSG